MDQNAWELLVSRIERIEEKVDRLLEFKWQIIGGAGILSVATAIGFQLISVIIKK